MLVELATIHVMEFQYGRVPGMAALAQNVLFGILELKSVLPSFVVFSDAVSMRCPWIDSIEHLDGKTITYNRC